MVIFWDSYWDDIFWFYRSLLVDFWGIEIPESRKFGKFGKIWEKFLKCTKKSREIQWNSRKIYKTLGNSRRFTISRKSDGNFANFRKIHELLENSRLPQKIRSEFPEFSRTLTNCAEYSRRFPKTGKVD